MRIYFIIIFLVSSIFSVVSGSSYILKIKDKNIRMRYKKNGEELIILKNDVILALRNQNFKIEYNDSIILTRIVDYQKEKIVTGIWYWQ